MQQDRGMFTAKDWRRVIWLEVAAFSIMGLMSIIGGDAIERAEVGMDGGLVGWGLSGFIAILFQGNTTGVICCAASFIVFVISLIGDIIWA